MDGYSISQAAEHTGFAPTTLRFYEQMGLVRPGRTPAGYRRYDDGDVEILTFIARAKGFGLTLEEIADLLDLLGDDRCAPVQSRLRDLLEAKLVEAQHQVADLKAFTAELRRAAGALDGPTPDGPCDDTCGCTVASEHAASDLVELTRLANRSSVPAIECSLDAERIDDRLAEWRAVLTHALEREAIAGGTRVRFSRDVDLPGVATLMAAEQSCCRFFTFALTVDIDTITLDVTAPPDAGPVVDALVGPGR
jgi:MerR family transcriptional regulator, copper efflux regulator